MRLVVESCDICGEIANRSLDWIEVKWRGQTLRMMVCGVACALRAVNNLIGPKRVVK